MTILDFSWVFLIFMGFVSLLGVISNELFIYAANEKKWNWGTRKGDIMFSVFTAPVVSIFGMPYVWLWADQKELFGITFSLGWYNAGTSLAVGILIIQLFSFFKKQATKKMKEAE